MRDKPPRRWKPPAIDESAACKAAYAELIDEEGYPMQCTNVLAQGYFSAGWRAAMKAMKKKTRKRNPPEMPKG